MLFSDHLTFLSCTPLAVVLELGGGGCLGEGGSMEAKSGGGGVKIIIFVLDIT
jgi:hypothetical protein